MIKNIILTSAIETENYKGYVTLENTSENTLVSIKTYNLPKTLNKRVLGVLIDGELYKVTLTNDQSYLINKKTDLNNKISVVLLEIENNTSKILIWGSNETSRVWQNSVAFNFNLDNENLNKNNILNEENLKNSNNSFLKENINQQNNVAQNFIKSVYTESKIDEDIESDEYIEILIDQNMQEDEYTLNESFTENNYNQTYYNNENYFNNENNLNFENDYNNNNNFSEFNNNLYAKENENYNTNNKSEFFASIESQIDELLNTYEEEKALEEIIPSSKFVKVDLEKNGNFYIFGVIYENKDIKYIVYGLPGEFCVKPDDEYSKFYQWLPLNQDNPEGYGYYLMYQDANNGNQIEMIIEEK